MGRLKKRTMALSSIDEALQDERPAPAYKSIMYPLMDFQSLHEEGTRKLASADISREHAAHTRL